MPQAKPSTPSSTPSAPAPIDPQRAAIEKLAKSLDPDYPAVFVVPTGGGIDEPAARYEGRVKPDFVAADDEGWR